MKKVFISIPMKNRKKEDIEASIKMLKDLGDVVIKEQHEYVNTLVQEQPPYLKDKDHTAVWYLGKSLEILSTCDILLKVNNTWGYPGCNIEHSVADAYNIPVISFDLEMVCPDLIKQIVECNADIYVDGDIDE